MDGRRVAAWAFPGPLRPGPHPIRLGAMGEKGVTEALKVIHKELDLSMAFCGKRDIRQVVNIQNEEQRSEH